MLSTLQLKGFLLPRHLLSGLCGGRGLPKRSQEKKEAPTFLTAESHTHCVCSWPIAPRHMTLTSAEESGDRGGGRGVGVLAEHQREDGGEVRTAGSPWWRGEKGSRPEASPAAPFRFSLLLTSGNQCSQEQQARTQDKSHFLPHECQRVMERLCLLLPRCAVSRASRTPALVLTA